MLRRLGVGVVALATLGLVTAGTAGAQGADSGSDMGSGADSGMSQGMGMGPMGMPGMGPMGMPGMGMPGMGMPGLGIPGMNPMGQGMSMGMGGRMGGRMDLPPLRPTLYQYPPTMVRTHHPGDTGWPTPCVGCVILVDPCEAYFQCESLPRAWWPEGLGLHPTVTYATVQRYTPGGPLTCAFPRGATTIVCSTPGPDDPASWETRTGLDPVMDHSDHNMSPGMPGMSQ